MTLSADNHRARRILLIEPPFYRLYGRHALVKYPLSLACLAHAVKTNTQWDVRVLNGDFAPSSEPFDVTYLTGEGFRHYTANLENSDADIWRHIRGVLSDYQPSVIGISVKSSSLASAYRIAGIAKELSRETLVIAGGPHPSATGPDMLNNPHIDVCVTGEGEETLADLLHAIDTGRPLSEVKGLSFRRDKDHLRTPPRKPLKDIDSLGIPDRFDGQVLIDCDNYPLHAFAYLFASRGCPYDCIFCGSREVWGRKVRFRSPGHVAEEIMLLQSAGVTSFHFDDDTFGGNHRYLRELCSTLETRCPGISWSCEIHVNLVTEENIAFMKKAGCATIQLGIESGNNEILKKTRKGFTIEEALAACRLIRRHGIGLHTFFMAGFPWETEESLLDTGKIIEGIECDKIIYSLFTPYPGTEAFRYCEAAGLIPKGYDPSLFSHQSPLNCFCVNLPPDRFRALSGNIEETVVRKNRLSWFKSET